MSNETNKTQQKASEAISQADKPNLEQRLDVMEETVCLLLEAVDQLMLRSMTAADLGEGAMQFEQSELTEADSPQPLAEPVNGNSREPR